MRLKMGVRYIEVGSDGEEGEKREGQRARCMSCCDRGDAASRKRPRWPLEAATPASQYSEAPMLADLVAAGDLPHILCGSLLPLCQFVVWDHLWAIVDCILSLVHSLGAPADLRT